MISVRGYLYQGIIFLTEDTYDTFLVINKRIIVIWNVVIIKLPMVCQQNLNFEIIIFNVGRQEIFIWKINKLGNILSITGKNYKNK